MIPNTSTMPAASAPSWIFRGAKSHKIVDYGKQILLNLQHRGASGADESTGDGAGILMQIPHEFFAAEADRLKFELPAAGHYGVGHPLPAARRRHPRHVRRSPRASALKPKV